jgi:hypothetical protein
MRLSALENAQANGFGDLVSVDSMNLLAAIPVCPCQPRSARSRNSPAAEARRELAVELV